MLKTKRLTAKFTETPSLGEHFVLELSNEITKKPVYKGKKVVKKGSLAEVFDINGETVRLRISKETALLLSDFIDKSLEF